MTTIARNVKQQHGAKPERDMLSAQLGGNPDPRGTHNAEHLRHHEIAQGKLFPQTGLVIYWGGGYSDSGHG